MPINTLVMGSSHMESTNVFAEYNTASQLGRFLNDVVYNIGISGHSFITCAANLNSALKKYRPKHVVIETGSIFFSNEDLTKILENKVPKIPAYNKGILALLRRNNFLRLMYAQYFKELFRYLVLDNAKSEEFSITPTAPENVVLLSRVLENLATTASQYEAKLIILYHPSISLNHDGSLTIDKRSDACQQFSKLCAQNGIYFIDMSKRFLIEYEKDFVLPYGFLNTSVGKGHTNKNGHRMYAEEIYKLIQEIKRIEVRS